MWVRLWILLGLAAAPCLADVIKTCAETQFCSDHRRLPSQYRYSAINPSINWPDGQVTFSLVSSIPDHGNLTMVITALAGYTFRLTIDENRPFRYKLQDVLVDDPVSIPFDAYGTVGGQVAVEAGRAKVQVRTGENFAVTFSLDGEEKVVIDGDQLLLEHSNTDSSLTFGVTFPNTNRLYGLHEHADRLSLRATSAENGPDPYRLRNLDVPGYRIGSTLGLYGVVPVLYAHGPTSTSGVFLHNAAEQWVETTPGVTSNVSRALFMARNGTLDLFILLGPTPTDVVRQYASLTGVAHLPQAWALGYHQSHWGYWTQEEVGFIISQFDDKKLPIDVIWLDIQYTDGYRYFTWEPQNFSDPIAMLDNLEKTNRKLVAITDPHFKVDENYEIYTEARDKDLFVKGSNGENFEGDCWPGRSSWLDYLNPKARDFYAGLFSYDVWTSTPTLAGIWNDMNEPSVFGDANERTMPNDATHYGGVDHGSVHGIYGFMQTKATHQGLIQRDNGTLRPFILTRSHFAGVQRYSAIWTGDNTANWENLAASWAMCLNSNLVGISFCGADVGGFIGDADEELLQRFYQAGAWLPFYRAHSDQNSRRREPYLYSESVVEVFRKALNERYVHLPFWYTVFYEHTRYGDPVIRPLFYHYPNDEKVLDIDDHLLVGGDILVRQVNQPGAQSVDVYLPGGSEQLWYATNGNERIHEGGQVVTVNVTMEFIPTFYRGGSIIVTKLEGKKNTKDTLEEGLTVIYVNFDWNYSANGTVYLDDYSSFKYRDNAEYSYLNMWVSECTEVLHACYLNIEPIDESNGDAFEFDFGLVIYQYRSESGDLVRARHTHTEDGKPLSSLKFSGKESVKLRTVPSS